MTDTVLSGLKHRDTSTAESSGNGRGAESSAAAKTKDAGFVQNLIPLEKWMLGIVLPLWLLLFVGGILIPTQPYRDAVSSLEGWTVLPSAFVVIGFYTVSNVLILCVLAALLGVVASRAQIELEVKLRDRINPYASGVLRAFVVFLLVVSGAMVAVQDPAESFLAATQEQYVRLAALMSLLGFLVGYNPELFSTVIAKHSPAKNGRGEDKRNEDSHGGDSEVG